MDSQTIEQLASELGLSLPTHAAQARARLDALSEITVDLSPEQPRHYLAGQLRGMVDRGEAITGEDVVAMVAANRAGANHTEAGHVLQQALEDAETILYQALQRSPSELVPAVRAQIEALYGEVRKLPSNTPTTPAHAIHGSPEVIASFRALEVLANRHSKLRMLHKALIADDSDATAFALFSDTRCRPAIAESGRSYVPAGPPDKVSRLRWLTTSEGQAWVPTAQECTAHYLETFRAMQAPKSAPASAVTVRA